METIPLLAQVVIYLLGAFVILYCLFVIYIGVIIFTTLFMGYRELKQARRREIAHLRKPRD